MNQRRLHSVVHSAKRDVIFNIVARTQGSVAAEARAQSCSNIVSSANALLQRGTRGKRGFRQEQAWLRQRWEGSPPSDRHNKVKIIVPRVELRVWLHGRHRLRQAQLHPLQTLPEQVQLPLHVPDVDGEPVYAARTQRDGERGERDTERNREK